MIQSFYSGANALSSQRLNIDVIADNVANIGTMGYKRARADFKDALYNRMKNPVENGPHMNLQHGAGSIPLQINRAFLQGATLTTERALDFVIEGRGFFTARGIDGETLYTRDGAFYIDNEMALVDAAGRYILDIYGDEITVLGNPEGMDIYSDGRIVFYDEDGDVSGEYYLGIVDFINPAGLLSMGDNYFTESENSGFAETVENPSGIRNYALESSNVDLAMEVTRMIRAQRAYQFASRAISVADQMAGIANSIRQ